MLTPAYAGIHNNLEAGVSSRFQWLGHEGAPRTNVANVHTSFLDNKLGGGIVFINDQIGVYNTTSFYGQLSYKTKITGDIMMSGGLQAGYSGYKIDLSGITQETDDPSISAQREQSTNIGAGLLVYSKKWFVSLSSPQLLESSASDGSSLISRHMYGLIGYVYTLNCFLRIKPTVLFKSVAGAPISVDYSLSVLINDKLWVGGTLRNVNSLDVYANYRITENVRAGYSYDIIMNGIGATNSGSHEINLLTNFSVFSKHMVLPRYF